MQIIIIAALSDNRVIGRDNKLVWYLPADLRFFKKSIENAFLLTGRKSYESNQGTEVFSADKEFVIITRNKNYQAKYGLIAHSVQAGIEEARKAKAKRLCILGGANIYATAMPLADKMILTEVHAQFEGDTFFPKINPTQWNEISRIQHEQDAENAYAYSFVEYEKIGKNPPLNM